MGKYPGTAKGEFEGAASVAVGAVFGGVALDEFGDAGSAASVAGWVLGQGGSADAGSRK